MIAFSSKAILVAITRGDLSSSHPPSFNNTSISGDDQLDWSALVEYSQELWNIKTVCVHMELGIL
jgi:hypothetical protein